MNKLIFILLCITLGQSNAFTQIKSASIPIGKRLSDNLEIIGNELQFNHNVISFQYDSTHQQILIATKGSFLNSINIGAIDKDITNYKWTKNDIKDYDLKSFGTKFFMKVGNNWKAVDDETGRFKSTIKANIIYVNTITNLALCTNEAYKARKSKDSIFIIDLDSGLKLWEEPFFKFGYANQVNVSKNQDLILTTEKYILKIAEKRGIIWFDSISNVYDYNASPSGIAVLSSVLNNSIYLVKNASIYNIFNIQSNICVDSLSCFYADKDYLRSYNQTDGSLAWEYQLPSNMLSTSILKLDDSTLFLINTGVAFSSSGLINYGKPFVASFNKITGKRKSFVYIDKYRADILDYRLTGELLTILFDDRLMTFEINSGKIRNELIFKPKIKPRRLELLKNPVYYINDEFEFIKIDSHHYCIKNDSFTYVLDKDLKINETIKNINLIKKISEYRDIELFTFQNRGVLVSRKNKNPQISLEMHGSISIVGNKLIDIDKKTVIYVNLDDLIKLIQ